ncbi:hypothetical protein N0V91_002147 [Didymella pomorum]|uniref:Uncharacterized protein n=1 Tax=Didymella pomorum TaxID=749634 RepID=A0A9W8ZKT0_9PLEO|nr:hypothetical protein N0V91_002147 [Didymella pomorum]
MFDGKRTIDAPDAGRYRSVHVPVLDSIWASVQARQGESKITQDFGKSDDFDIVGLYNSERASRAKQTRDLQIRLNEKEGEYQTLIKDVEGIEEQREKLIDENTTLKIQVNEREHALEKAYMLQEVKRLEENRPKVVQVLKEDALEDGLSNTEADADAEAAYDEKYMLAKEPAWLMIEKELKRSEKENLQQ